MAIIKKVPLDEIIDVFMDLYNKGVDFIDLIASEKRQQNLCHIQQKNTSIKKLWIILN